MTEYAFLSYAHSDDHFLDGGISWLRERLEMSIRAVSGHPFTIFQDKDGIEFGQRWPKRLDDALKSARFLIPILTPSYFSSSSCRAEALKFFEYERAAKRDDLILPIYLISVAAFEHERLRENDKLAALIYERQYRDWRFCVPDIRDAHGIKNHIVALAKEIDASAKRRMSSTHADSNVSDPAAEADRALKVSNESSEDPHRASTNNLEQTKGVFLSANAVITMSRYNDKVEYSVRTIYKLFWNFLNYLYNSEKTKAAMSRPMLK